MQKRLIESKKRIKSCFQALNRRTFLMIFAIIVVSLAVFMPITLATAPEDMLPVDIIGAGDRNGAEEADRDDNRVELGEIDDEKPPEGGESETGETLTLEAQELITESQVELATEMKTAILRNIADYIDLQGTVEQWIKNTPGQIAVEVYDLDFHRVAASHNANAIMSPKSLYKLFYAYDGYKQVSAGVEDENQPYLGEKTLGTCLDIMIRNSDNPCAEAMLDDTARAGRVAEMIRSFGLSQTAADGLSTSAHDVSLLLQRYWTHAGWSGVAWTKFLNSALTQPAYLRKGLPNGFRTATVYNKAGFGPGGSGYVYNDAAIVEFPGGRHYAVVVMTSGASQASLAGLGAEIERAVLYEN